MAKTILEENIARDIESDGLTVDGKTIYGKVDVFVNDDGTADVRIGSNGRVFKYTIQLYVDKPWKVISEEG
ncbi:hypothetical protein IJM16_01700 [Candidatus Saccharibacteria bacterium]|nr:hypothetical protein [Candidatus Saccharibacteria bacterium]